jgi:ribosomal protein L7/L12
MKEVEFEPEVVAAINSGQKVTAIKILRQKRGIGLKEAKELVDAYSENAASESGGAKTTGDTVVKVKSNNGIISIVVFVIVAFFIYRFVVSP